MSFKSEKNKKFTLSGSMWRILILLLIIFFVYSTGNLFLVSNGQGFKQKKNFMETHQTKNEKVPPGIWGGTGINLTVEEEGARLEFDCAEAKIGETLIIDNQGKFSAEGTFKRRSPGALRIGFEPKSQPATFVGQISDKKMTLKITFTENKEEIGEYNLERGKEARLRRCR
jgi:hypothetical protein